MFSAVKLKLVYANASVKKSMDKKHDDLTEILSQVLNDLKNELGDGFDLNKIKLQFRHHLDTRS